MALEIEKDNQPITAVISHLVKPGREIDYEQWLKGVAAAAKQFDGHLGVSIIRPHDHTYPEYVSILKFDRYSNLKQWMESDIRKGWIDRAKPLIQKDEEVQALTGLETWFTLPGRQLRAPMRYKIAILTTFAVYSLSTIFGVLLTPILSSFSPLIRSFIIVALVVVALTYVVMPNLTRLLHRWLYPK